MALLDIFRRNRPVYVRSVRVGTEAVLGMSVERLYRTQPALRAVVSFLADNMSSVPLKVYDRSADNDRPRVTEGPLYELLSRPSPTLTPQQLWNGTAYDYLLYDSALWYVYESVDAPSGYEIWRVPWAWVREERTEDGLNPSEFVIQNPDGMRAPVSVRARDCVLFRAYDPMGPLHHASRVDSLKQVLSEQISAWQFRNSIWKNGGRVTQYLTRPLNAPDWDKNEGRKRFAKSWKERYSGDGGVNTGGTPLLEDGMELKSVAFNAREAQWQEATRLTREDVAAVYHVNPSVIWHTDGQTYASAKDNARALYSDTLAPTLNMFENVVNHHLAARVGAPPTQYAEFDLDVKLAASFEERISAMQSSVGGPWMTRNEARAKMNYPALDGCDELIVPMNVTAGGLASPNDTDPTVERYNAAPVAFVQDGVVHATPTKGEPANPSGPRAAEAVRDEDETVTLKSVAEAPKSAVSDVEACLTRFLERQCRSVVNAIAGGGRKSRRKDAGDYPFWWDAVRWNRELADDLEPLFRTICDLRGAAAMADIGEPADAWDGSRTANFVRAMAERRADLFNEVTYEQLAAALLEFEEGDPGLITAAERSFLDHAQSRAARGARTFATAVSGFATKEAVNQRYPTDTDRLRRTKTWRHHRSDNPRSSHAAMDGETVGLDERFSNGADYPGDLSLPAKEAANCHCTMEVGVESKEYSLSSITLRSEDYKGSEVREFEEARFFDADNNPIGGLFRGDDYHVNIVCPEGYEWEEVRTCHTHPHGGTFSVYKVDDEGNETGDIFTLTDSGMLSSDVVTEHHIRSLSRTPEANPEGFLEAAKEAYDEAADVAYDEVLDTFVRDHPGELFDDDYMSEYEPMALRAASRIMDSWYNENSQLFGYEYVMTGRRE